MTPSHIQRRIRPALITLALIAAGLVAACGQSSSSTTVVLTGPPDKVAALVAQHKALAPPVPARVETLGDGRERAAFHLPKGLPMGEVIALGKDAAKVGVSYEFSSGTNWNAGSPADPPSAQPSTEAPPQPPARSAGRTV
jgi:hypothetical protein